MEQCNDLNTGHLQKDALQAIVMANIRSEELWRIAINTSNEDASIYSISDDMILHKTPIQKMKLIMKEEIEPDEEWRDWGWQRDER